MNNWSLTYRSVADFVVVLYVVKGRYKCPFTSRNFIGLWKGKRYRRNMMFLFARHYAGLLNNNHVQLKLPWLLESQLHGSQRKSYLSAPFFFHLRYEWLVKGRLYLPNQRYECTAAVKFRLRFYLFYTKSDNTFCNWLNDKEIRYDVFHRQYDFSEVIADNRSAGLSKK